MLNNEHNEVKKANPTPTGKGSSMTAGSPNMAKQIPSPSLIGIGIDEVNKKESIIEWVHRRFGTSMEELREMNVTGNHSCQEIPSQTYDDSKEHGTNIEVSYGTTLWSDEVEIVENDTNENLSPKSKEESHNKQADLASNLSPKSTVNPRSSKPRVEDGEGIGQPTADPIVGVGQDTNIEVSFTCGSKSKASPKKNTNRIVNPKDTA